MKFYPQNEHLTLYLFGQGLCWKQIEWPYWEMLGTGFHFNPVHFASKLSLNIQLNQVIDRWWCGIPLAPESTWPDSPSRQIRSHLCPALDQVTGYIVSCAWQNDLPHNHSSSFVPVWSRADDGSLVQIECNLSSSGAALMTMTWHVENRYSIHHSLSAMER